MQSRTSSARLWPTVRENSWCVNDALLLRRPPQPFPLLSQLPFQSCLSRSQLKITGWEFLSLSLILISCPFFCHLCLSVPALSLSEAIWRLLSLKAVFSWFVCKIRTFVSTVCSQRIIKPMLPRSDSREIHRIQQKPFSNNCLGILELA